MCFIQIPFIYLQVKNSGENKKSHVTLRARVLRVSSVVSLSPELSISLETSE